MIIFELIFVAALLGLADAIPIDNNVEGQPVVECGSITISVSIQTRNEFQGRVFIKGRFNDSECRNDDVGRRVAGITVPFTKCGLFRSRSLNPRGVFVGLMVVVSFHPVFLTKVDRAYTIQCFYMEAEKTVGQGLEVSEVTSAFRSELVPMPVCRYEIFDRSPNGKPIKFVVIGQQVYHKWTCESDTTDTFCMLIHFCFVSDGSGNNADLIDPNGCAFDKFLLGNLEYSTDLMAGKEAHVFKFADTPALFFQCQIAIAVKGPGQQCPLKRCDDPQRRKRSTNDEDIVGVVDVKSQSLFTFDVEEKFDDKDLPKNVVHRNICFTKGANFLSFSILLTFLFLMSVLFLYYAKKRCKKM